MGAVLTQNLRGALAMQSHQGVDGGVIERGFIAAARDDGGVEVVPQVLQDGETRPRIEGDDFRGGEALSPKPAGGGDKGVHPPGGQPGHRVIARRAAVRLRGVRRTRRAFHRRLVHEDQGRGARPMQPLIAPGGGVPRQGLPASATQALGGQEGLLGRFTIRTQYAVPSTLRAAQTERADLHLQTQSLYRVGRGEVAPPDAPAIQ